MFIILYYRTPFLTEHLRWLLLNHTIELQRFFRIVWIIPFLISSFHFLFGFVELISCVYAYH